MLFHLIACLILSRVQSGVCYRWVLIQSIATSIDLWDTYETDCRAPLFLSAAFAARDGALF